MSSSTRHKKGKPEGRECCTCAIPFLVRQDSQLHATTAIWCVQCGKWGTIEQIDKYSGIESIPVFSTVKKVNNWK